MSAGIIVWALLSYSPLLLRFLKDYLAQRVFFVVKAQELP